MEERFRQRRDTIRRRKDFPADFSLSPGEEEFFRRIGSEEKASLRSLKLAITPHYFSLIGNEEDDPIRLQAIPRVEEFDTLPYEKEDPLEDLRYSPVERLVHRYRDRVLILLTGECLTYCRHCFRRHFSSHGSGAIQGGQLEAVLDYIRGREDIHEVILSGGDPLSLEDERFFGILRRIQEAVPRPLIIRIATRAPVVMPQRMAPPFLDGLADFPRVFLITQFNHPRELSRESGAVLDACADRGIPVYNQAVLLKGVNDSVETLSQLFQRLLEFRVKPYYLFQGDLASGTSHFRVPLDRGMELYRQLRQRISGLAMPTYAVDLPGGGGKVPLVESYLDTLVEGEGGEAQRAYRFTGPDGLNYYYPAE